MPLDGGSTNNVKNAMETWLKYSYVPIYRAGTFAVSALQAVTWTANADYSLPATGEDLVVRNSVICKSDNPIVVTVAGTDPLDAVITGVATILARSQLGASFNVVEASSKKFKTITGVTITGGVAGDEFELRVLPASGSYTTIAFLGDYGDNPGDPDRPIYDHFEIDHYKRQRMAMEITIASMYLSDNKGLRRIQGQELTLLFEIRDNGRSLVTESLFFDGVRLNAPTAIPEDGDGSISAAGTYKDMLSFS